MSFLRGADCEFLAAGQELSFRSAPQIQLVRQLIRDVCLSTLPGVLHRQLGTIVPFVVYSVFS